MKAITVVDGLVAPMNRSNVDTDAIIPKQFLKSIKRTGFGPNLFDAWRYLDPGEPGMDNSKRPLNPEFVLNQSRYQGASILLARDNFGCGSSREHAPWALVDYGFTVVIAQSFADIFAGNSFKNGLLLVALPQEQVDRLLALAEAGHPITVDLENQVVTSEFQDRFAFPMDPFRKHCLMNGLDEIGLTDAMGDAIAAHETRLAAERPWTDGAAQR